MRKTAIAFIATACLLRPDVVSAADVSWDSVNTYFKATVITLTRLRVEARACGLSDGESLAAVFLQEFNRKAPVRASEVETFVQREYKFESDRVGDVVKCDRARVLSTTELFQLHQRLLLQRLDEFLRSR